MEKTSRKDLKTGRSSPLLIENVVSKLMLEKAMMTLKKAMMPMVELQLTGVWKVCQEKTSSTRP